LVEVYVQEVLKTIISAHQAKKVISLFSLYDKLESHLRALETLCATNTSSAMLFLLVESCLPEEFLRAWHWRMNTSQGGEAKE
jgi:tRNA C32,U32 (ribose-2'-O)-methylase TrmJ